MVALVLSCLYGLSPLPLRAEGPTVSLSALPTADGVADCVRWAAGDVTAALQSAGVDPASADIQLTTQFDHDLAAEAFDLRVNGSQVQLLGGDAVGQMYALFELAEQIRSSSGRASWQAVIDSLKSTRQKPFLEFRADNAFLHTSPAGPLFDVPMWNSYIDMLARDRFNVLDMHGTYDLKSTVFPNIYPMILHLPDFPNIGDAAAASKNLADFKAIVAHAKQRGVRVVFMNYSVGAKDLPKDQVADYTKEAVDAFIRELPDLDMIGFRVGESGQKDSFFQDVYLKSIAESNRPHIPLYTRSWGAKRADLEKISSQSGTELNIEIKFNGEQLGLPYQAMHGSDYTHPTNPAYSYQDYLSLPANFKIIWQIRANGTHRYWAWENTDFIRRTVRSAAWGNARGFSLEPPIAYYPYAAAEYYAQPADQHVYDYIWQKHWPWYLAWGRLAYDPDLPDSVLINTFRQHFGDAAPEIYQAMQQSGKIVPMVMAYRDQGPDQRDYSPETETGHGGRKFGIAKDRTTDPLLYFAYNTPMDGRTFAGIWRFVDDKLHNRPDGSVGPAQVAAFVADAATTARSDIDKVPAMTGRSADEWRLLRTDLLCASWLGNYFSARTLGMTHLLYALDADSQTDYEKASTDLARSLEDWQHLSAVAAAYAPQTDNLRKEKNFRWSNSIDAIEALNASADKIWQERKPTEHASPLQFTPGQLGQPTGIVVSDLAHTLNSPGRATISCHVVSSTDIAQVILWCKDLPSTNDWASKPMQKLGDSDYVVDVPITAHGLLYQVEAQARSGEAVLFPNVFDQTPYQAIMPAQLQQQ